MVDALRNEYELNELLEQLKLPRSSYYYARKKRDHPEKYTELRRQIKESFISSNSTYGYRRIHAELRHTFGKISEKIIRKIMREDNLKVICVKVKKYSAYEGEISPETANLVERKFHADAPNKLILTDITEFHIPAGKVYLSPAIDCFDGMPAAWTIGTSPNAELVNTILDSVISQLGPGDKPVIHSERGGQYRWPDWIRKTEESGIIRSMSRKGCFADNAACEGFFGHLKTEMFYGRNWEDVSLEKFIDILNRYIILYREKRIKETLGYMSPIEYRKSKGIAVLQGGRVSLKLPPPLTERRTGA